MDLHDRRLDAAVQLGVITALQAEAIRAIAPARGDRPRHAPGPIDAAMVGYVLGAITVVAAMTWFLADRWEWLGPGGALAVSLLYGLILVVTSERLRAEGFGFASGIAMLLAVATVPPAMVALNALTGWFVEFRGSCRTSDFDFLVCRGEELLVELATIAAALLALRRTRFAMLSLPVVAFVPRLVFMVAELAGVRALGLHTQGWLWALATTLLVAIAYGLERTQEEDLDVAVWVHAIAFVCAVPATMQLVGLDEVNRHLLVPIAFVAFAVALLLRRAAWLVYGIGCFTSYVVWLAAERFRDTPAFPIVLAALGVAMLIATVWVQRNTARLAALVGVPPREARPRLPGGMPLLLLPTVIALLLLPGAIRTDAEAEAAQQRIGVRLRREAQQRDAARRAARRQSGSQPRPEETPPPARP